MDGEQTTDCKHRFRSVFKIQIKSGKKIKHLNGTTTSTIYIFFILTFGSEFININFILK